MLAIQIEDPTSRDERWSADEFARVAERCAPRVRAAIGRDALAAGVDVDDVFQDAVVRGLDHLGDFRSESEVLPWLIVVARRILIDRVRSAYQRRVLPLGDVRRLDRPATTPDPSAAAVNGDAHHPMRAALAALPDSQRHALVASVIQGMSRREIAHELGLTEAAVGPLLYRATNTMRKHLAGVAAFVLLPLRRLRQLVGGAGRTSASGIGLHTAVAVVALGVAIAVSPMAPFRTPGPVDDAPNAGDRLSTGAATTILAATAHRPGVDDHHLAAADAALLAGVALRLTPGGCAADPCRSHVGDGPAPCGVACPPSPTPHGRFAVEVDGLPPVEEPALPGGCGGHVCGGVRAPDMPEGPDYESHMRSDGLPEVPGVDPDAPPGAASSPVTRAVPDVVDLTPAAR